MVANHDRLLNQVANVGEMEDVLAQVRVGVRSLADSLATIKADIVAPHAAIAQRTRQLSRIHAATRMMRGIQRYVTLVGKIKRQMGGAAGGGGLGGGRTELASAAKSVRESQLILEAMDLSGIDVVTREAPVVEDARRTLVLTANKILDKSALACLVFLVFFWGGGLFVCLLYVG